MLVMEIEKKKKEVWRKNEEGLVTRIGRGSKNDWNLETH